MVKLSLHHYNYRVTQFVKEPDGHYVKVYDKLFSQLKDIQNDLPHMSIKELQYLARHSSIVRVNEKFKGLTIQKIHPIAIY